MQKSWVPVHHFFLPHGAPTSYKWCCINTTNGRTYLGNWGNFLQQCKCFKHDSFEYRFSFLTSSFCLATRLLHARYCPTQMALWTTRSAWNGRNECGLDGLHFPGPRSWLLSAKNNWRLFLPSSTLGAALDAQHCFLIRDGLGWSNCEFSIEEKTSWILNSPGTCTALSQAFEGAKLHEKAAVPEILCAAVMSNQQVLCRPAAFKKCQQD